MPASHVPDTLTCVDCGGVCHLLSLAPEDGWHAGDVAVYRCSDCMDRWDVEVPEAYDDEHDSRPFG